MDILVGALRQRCPVGVYLQTGRRGRRTGNVDDTAALLANDEEMAVAGGGQLPQLVVGLGKGLLLVTSRPCEEAAGWCGRPRPRGITHLVPEADGVPVLSLAALDVQHERPALDVHPLVRHCCPIQSTRISKGKNGLGVCGLMMS